MPRRKDTTLTARIFALKQSGLSNARIARELNINPMTVGKHVKSTEFDSLAHSLAHSNAENIQAQITEAHKVVMATIALKDNIYQCPKCGKIKESPQMTEEMAIQPISPSKEAPKTRVKKSKRCNGTNGACREAAIEGIESIESDNPFEVTQPPQLLANITPNPPICQVCDESMLLIQVRPSKEAQMMVRVLANTQTSRLLGTRANDVTVNENSKHTEEDRQRLIREMMEE